MNKWPFYWHMNSAWLFKQLCFVPGSRWGGTLYSRWESDSGRRGPQALDRAAREHPHLLSVEAVRERKRAAAAAQVQALQVTTLDRGLNSWARKSAKTIGCNRRKSEMSASLTLSSFVNPQPVWIARLKVEHLWISFFELIILTVSRKERMLNFVTLKKKLQIQLPFRPFLYGDCVLGGLSFHTPKTCMMGSMATIDWLP